MNYEEIINIEKTHFSSIHSEFDKFIKLLKQKNLKSEQIPNESLKQIIILNKKMDELYSHLNDLCYSLDKPNKINKQSKTNKEIENYEKNDNTIKSFLPFILYYRMMLDN